MVDMGASVLARLKNKAMETGKSYQLCMQLFCQEEFLRRLEKSAYCDNLVLKGGLFLYTLTNYDSRVTMDVDFLLRKLPNTPEKLQTVLEEIIATETGNDYISFEIKSIAPIAIAKKYAGIGASLVARIKNTRTPFSIDFGVGDVIVPRSEKRTIPVQLPGFSAPRVNTYSLETTVAEKLDAILSLMEFSSRMKDYYDLWYLASHFDFDHAQLVNSPTPYDAEFITRFEMVGCPPDILVTNYSMLEYMLMRKREANIWEQTKEWLHKEAENKLLIVLDEAHMYRGSAGGEIALLLDRLFDRLDITLEKVQFILTTASMPDDESAIIGMDSAPVLL